jgi:hypothetical protein
MTAVQSERCKREKVGSGSLDPMTPPRTSSIEAVSSALSIAFGLLKD